MMGASSGKGTQKKDTQKKDTPRKDRLTSETATQEPRPRERSAFKTLLLSNPNYFGNLPANKLKAVQAFVGNTFYEQLGCVGYHPQQRQLEGVVYINQPSGYGGDICSVGTPEYVRFYLSFDNGATWVDQGMTSFQVYDVPEGTEGSKRLENAVSLPASPPRRFCFLDPLIRVRAILSWNNPPPANTPGWLPIFGNVAEQTILREPQRLIFPGNLFELAKVELPPTLAELVDFDLPFKTKVKQLNTGELAQLYRDTKIPVHRFAHKELMSFATGKSSLSAEDFVKFLPDLQLDPKIFELLFPTDGNTSFEELRCIGLDPNLPNMLVGVIQIKGPSGFSGAPCTSGSKEYVTFWADFDGNGSFETCLGTADVTVYDVTTTPAEGYYAAVRLPVDLTEHRRDCGDGPVVVRIRAILSWNTPVDCSNPNQVPTWGNREEGLVLVSPLASAPSGKIAILGGIPVSMINDFTGLTTPDAVFATNNFPPDALGRACPFGGRVTVQGAPIVGFTYKVQVSLDGFLWTDVVTPLQVTDANGDVNPHTADPITNRFDYLPFTSNINGLLAQWDTTGDALWFVRLSVFNGGGVLQGTDTHRIQLDNTAPEASIEITTGLGDCGKFDIGITLAGNFVARDAMFASYSIGIEPVINDPGEAIPVPSSSTTQTAVAPGDLWTLDTTGMDGCGYIIRVHAVDLAIVNSQSTGHHAFDSKGFCLE